MLDVSSILFRMPRVNSGSWVSKYHLYTTPSLIIIVRSILRVLTPYGHKTSTTWRSRNDERLNEINFYFCTLPLSRLLTSQTPYYREFVCRIVLVGVLWAAPASADTLRCPHPSSPLLCNPMSPISFFTFLFMYVHVFCGFCTFSLGSTLFVPPSSNETVFALSFFSLRVCLCTTLNLLAYEMFSLSWVLKTQYITYKDPKDCPV